jgi:hypothetical protein
MLTCWGIVATSIDAPHHSPSPNLSLEGRGFLPQAPIKPLPGRERLYCSRCVVAISVDAPHHSPSPNLSLEGRGFIVQDAWLRPALMRFTGASATRPYIGSAHANAPLQHQQSTICNLQSAIKGWRGCMGVEPTCALLKGRTRGFEDRGTHQGPSTPIGKCRM